MKTDGEEGDPYAVLTAISVREKRVSRRVVMARGLFVLLLYRSGKGGDGEE